MKTNNTFPNLETFNAVAKRAVADVGIYSDEVSYRCDLLTAHADIGLDFDQLLESSPREFRHDIVGLSRSVDRYKSKVIEFIPICSIKEAV